VLIDLECLHAMRAVDGDRAGAGQYRGSEGHPCRPGERPGYEGVAGFLDDCHRGDPGVPEREQVGERDEFRAHDHGAAARALMRAVHELLQGTGGEHAPGARAAHQARGSGRLARPQGEEDRPGAQRVRAARARDTQRAVGIDAQERVPGAQVDTGRRSDDPPGVVGPLEDPVKFLEAEARMRAKARNAARLGVAFEYDDVADAEPHQFGRRGEACDPRADDDDFVVGGVQG
jgi:hypothetical protein